MARSEQEEVGDPDEEAFFASQEGAKRPTVLAAGTRLYKKVEVARSEQEEVGDPDEEAFFASQEGAKRPTVLAAGTRLYKKNKSNKGL
ncbi:hypothetical protein [Bacillus clarus]|uniref:hypothetical protein n=1 Tax=Bacillus clarus TaxID=2338372 RepID=UPI0009B90B5B|nr:hypothetical protein [Bacillus clarus]